MIKRLDRKGISPVIATVLLVALAVILAVIIFMWAKQFITEKLSKGGEVIENSCNQVIFSAEIRDKNIYVVNNGNIAIYGVSMRKVDAGETGPESNPFEKEGQEFSIKAGETKDVAMEGDVSGTYEVMPILLGSDDNGDRKSYTCTKNVQTVSTP